MTGAVGQRKDIWLSTAQMLADIDKDGHFAGLEGVCDLDDPREEADEHKTAGRLGGQAAPSGDRPDGEDDQPGTDVAHPPADTGVSTQSGCTPDLAADSGTQASQSDPDGEPVGDNPLPAASDAGAGLDGAKDDEAAEPRYNKSIALGFAAATVVMTLVISGVMLAMRHGPHTDDQDHPSQPSTQLSVVAAPTTSGAPVAGGPDNPIPYTATAVGCLPGSSAAQPISGTDPTQAWVCVHGGMLGQHLVINLGRTMVITAVSLTPGWVGADAAGADQWLQHRVVTRVQWSFNDSPPTVVAQDTHSVHGEAPQPMPGRGVLASRIILLIQETGRAPADVAPSLTPSPAPGPGGLFTDILGPPASPTEPSPTGTTALLPGLPPDQTRTDPADNTFAVSSVKIFGHPPQ